MFKIDEKIVEDWIEAMRSQLLQLPDMNLRVIKRLVKFLQHYHQEQQKVNQIPTERTVDSLSKVFGHLFFRTWDSEQGSYDDRKISQSLFSKLLFHYDQIFTRKEKDIPTMFSQFRGTTVDPRGNGKVRKEIPSTFHSNNNNYNNVTQNANNISLEKKSNITLTKKPEKTPIVLEKKSTPISLEKYDSEDSDEEESCVLELDIDTYSTPHLEIMCEEVRSQVAVMKQQPNQNLPRSHERYSKPLPKPPV